VEISEAATGVKQQHTLIHLLRPQNRTTGNQFSSGPSNFSGDRVKNYDREINPVG